MDNLQIAFIVIVGGVAGFLLLREVFTWYWKVNEICSNQRKTNELLQEQNELLRASNETLKQFIEGSVDR